MQLKLSHLAGRLSRHLPKHRMIRRDGLAARLFVPWGCHYVASDLQELEQGRREPELYQWLSGLPQSAVLFDVGTSYGQEAALASSLQDRDVTVVGFDCGLLHAHFCALNKRLNNDRFEFVFAAVGETSGMPVPITCNSDTHLPHLHRAPAPQERAHSYDRFRLARPARDQRVLGATPFGVRTRAVTCARRLCCVARSCSDTSEDRCRRRRVWCAEGCGKNSRERGPDRHLHRDRP